MEENYLFGVSYHDEKRKKKNKKRLGLWGSGIRDTEYCTEYSGWASFFFFFFASLRGG